MTKKLRTRKALTVSLAALAMAPAPASCMALAFASRRPNVKNFGCNVKPFGCVESVQYVVLRVG